jgi:hypothetical protein
VRSILDGAVMSTVNWSEAIQKVDADGVQNVALMRVRARPGAGRTR